MLGVKITDGSTREFKDVHIKIGNAHMISIRFCNSGSYYQPFNAVFMRMFSKAQHLKEREFQKLNYEHELELE